MSNLAINLWAAMETLFTDPEHEELLSELLHDESDEKIEFFLREALPEEHLEEDYREAVAKIEELARFVTDDVNTELIAYHEFLGRYPVLGELLTETDAVTLVEAFHKDEGDEAVSELHLAAYYVGVYLLAKAEELQHPGFSIEAQLS
jgi:hypothetical protein